MSVSAMKGDGRRLNAAERVALEVAEFRRAAKIDSWTSFVEELQVPSDIYPAILTGRPELLRATPARDLPKHQVEVLYKLIAGLIETNMALRGHTERVAQLTDHLNGALMQFHSAARSIQQFANFAPGEVSEEEESDHAAT